MGPTPNAVAIQALGWRVRVEFRANFSLRSRRSARYALAINGQSPLPKATRTALGFQQNPEFRPEKLSVFDGVQVGGPDRDHARGPWNRNLPRPRPRPRPR
jgi:hypothetical protein